MQPLVSVQTLLAEGTGPQGAGYWPVVGAALFAAAVFGVVLTALRCYKRCPSNKVLVKWGVGTGANSASCVHGGGTLVFPVFQDYDYLSLETDPDRDPAARGALVREHPRECAERLHRRDRHPARGDAERRDPPAEPHPRGGQRPGVRPDLRPAPPGDRVDGDRRDQTAIARSSWRTSRTRWRSSSGRSAWC